MPGKRNHDYWENAPIQRTGESTGANAGGQSEGSLAGAATAVKDTARDLASSVASRAGNAWDSTRGEVQQAASAVADTATDLWSDVMGFMRRYPFATLCFGLGIGFCLSRLIEGRSMSTFGHWDFGRSPSGHDHGSSRFSDLRS